MTWLHSWTKRILAMSFVELVWIGSVLISTSLTMTLSLPQTEVMLHSSLSFPWTDCRWWRCFANTGRVGWKCHLEFLCTKCTRGFITIYFCHLLELLFMVVADFYHMLTVLIQFCFYRTNQFDFVHVWCWSSTVP